MPPDQLAARRSFLLDGEELRIVAASGDTQAATMTGYRMPVAGSLVGLALESGEPVQIADAPHEKNEPGRCRHLPVEYQRKSVVDP